MNTPKIRFKGFKDDWEQRKLGDVAEFLDTMRKPLEGARRIPGPYPYYGASGIVDYVDGYLFNEELVLLSEDGANITDRNYPVCFLASGKYWVNNHAHVLRLKDGNENNFICTSLERKDYKQYNSGMAMPKLNQEVCRRIPIGCPSFNEQKKIGDYFRNLDHLITLHQRKCDETKELKKFMLQKLFPKNGQKNPEIRFEGFTDDWEQRKLGDISQITAGGTPSTKELTYWEPKEVPWLASGEVHKKYIYDTDEMISEEGLNNSSAKWVEEGSVLIALAGQGKTRGTAAITRIPITTNQSIAAIKFNDILDADYAFHNLDSRYDELRNISSGDGTRGGLNKQLLADLTIAFPQIYEQREIGEYFTALDHLITLHQRKQNGRNLK